MDLDQIKGFSVIENSINMLYDISTCNLIDWFDEIQTSDIYVTALCTIAKRHVGSVTNLNRYQFPQ